jgi:hypothetical protein
VNRRQRRALRAISPDTLDKLAAYECPDCDNDVEIWLDTQRRTSSERPSRRHVSVAHTIQEGVNQVTSKKVKLIAGSVRLDTKSGRETRRQAFARQRQTQAWLAASQQKARKRDGGG